MFEGGYKEMGRFVSIDVGATLPIGNCGPINGVAAEVVFIGGGWNGM